MRKLLTILGVIALFLLLALAALGGWAYYQFLYTTPLTPQEIEDLHVDWQDATRGNWTPWWDPGSGEPVWNPGASFNAWLETVPEEDKAWPLMLKAYFDHKAIFDHDLLGTIPTNEHDWAQLEPTLATADADAALTKVIEAFHKPVLGAWWSNTDMEPYEHAAQVAYAESNPETQPGEREVYHPGPMTFDSQANTAMIEVLLPSLGRQRNLTNFARSKAAYELQQGNADTFVSAMEATLAGSDLALEIPTLIGVLVETAVEHITLETIDWALANHRDEFDEPMLARLEHALAQHADASYVWQGEAMMVNDTIRRISDDRGAIKLSTLQSIENDFGFMGGGLGEPVNLPDAELHASSQRAILVDLLVLRSVSGQAELPWDGQPTDSWQIFEQERPKLNFISARFLDIMLPALEKASERIRHHTQSVVALRLGIAAHRHFERHGVFPETIEGIDDDLITFEPIDVFTGNPLGYTLTSDGPLVYSVGPDRVDNAGTQGWDTEEAWDGTPYRVKKRIEWWTTEQASSYASDPSAQWDWVLFPIPQDEEPSPEAEYDPDWDLKQDGMFTEEAGAKNAPEDGEDG